MQSDALTRAPAAPWREALAIAGFHAGVLALALLPIMLVEIPDLVDYPNHLARWYVVHALAEGGPIAENYVRSLAFSPYLLLDLIAVELVGLVGIYDTGRLVLGTIVATTYAGALTLHRVLFGRIGVWPAVAALFVYHHALAWGFLNFSFGIGLLLLAVAAWVAARPRAPLIRLALLATLTGGLYVCHILVTGAFMVIVGAEALSRWLSPGRPDPRAMAVEALTMALPFAGVFAAFFPWMGGVFYEPQEPAPFFDYGDIFDKLRALLSPILFIHESSIVEVLTLSAIAFGTLLALQQRAFRIAAGWRLPLVCLALVAAAMPLSLLGTFGVDFRLPVIVLLVAIAASTPGPVRAPWRLLGAAAIAGLVFLRVEAIRPGLEAADAGLREAREAIHAIEPGAAVLMARSETGFAGALRGMHGPAMLAVIERDAFSPQLFTGLVQVRAAPRRERLDSYNAAPLVGAMLREGLAPDFITRFDGRILGPYVRVYWADWPARFDYLIAFEPFSAPPEVGRHLREIARTSDLMIYRIEPRR